MDVFIGWSGVASLVMAKGLRQWLRICWSLTI